MYGIGIPARAPGITHQSSELSLPWFMNVFKTPPNRNGAGDGNRTHVAIFNRCFEQNAEQVIGLDEPFMATGQKTPASRNWLCYYTDHNGKRPTKSSLTRNKREAERICAKIQSVEDQARTRSEEHMSELQSHSFISYA